MSYSESQLQLQAHIEKENQAHSDNMFPVTSEIDHWADSGVFSISQYERYMAIESNISVFREIYGVKPYMDFSAMSTEKINADTDFMIASETKEQEENAAFEAKLIKERKENNKRIPNNPFAILKTMMQGA